MNLGDPELELIDPTPNVHALFVHFDKLFFWTSLASRAIVRWSKRMYSCAGICSYDRVGLCEIALSEPLLKLRPRKDLIETLLHEMIHAYLFITNRDRDRDGHGPNFKAHMHRINQSAGLNISIYHDFHDEVKLYQTHWWRCDGPCQNQRPYFGVVRRAANRAPGPSDRWWLYHQRKCGGTFVKIKEPEPKTKDRPKNQNGDITKYINRNKIDKNINTIHNDKTKSTWNDSNINSRSKPIKSYINNNTLVVSKKNVIFNPKATVKSPTVPFSGEGNTLGAKKNQSITDITETVRNIWANKFITSTDKKNKKSLNNITSGKQNKNKNVEVSIASPPKKMMKIDDYFKNSVKNILKDVYSQDFIVTQKSSDSKLNVLAVNCDLVECPVCKDQISSNKINGHLDECLNKDLIESISKDTNIASSDTNSKAIIVNKSLDSNISTVENTRIATNDNILEIQKDNNNRMTKIKRENEDYVDLTWMDYETNKKNIKTEIDSTNDANICPCCGKQISNAIQEHLDECLIFFDNNETVPEDGASTSTVIDTIVLDDDEEFDETLTLNATGTKSPCPCCLEMIEEADMNNHLDICLS